MEQAHPHNSLQRPSSRCRGRLHSSPVYWQHCWGVSGAVCGGRPAPCTGNPELTAVPRRHPAPGCPPIKGRSLMTSRVQFGSEAPHGCGHERGGRGEKKNWQRSGVLFVLDWSGWAQRIASSFLCSLKCSFEFFHTVKSVDVLVPFSGFYFRSLKGTRFLRYI